MRQAVHQVEIKSPDPFTAETLEHRFNHFRWLNAMDRFLYIGVKFLNTQAHAIKSKTANCPDHAIG